MAKAYNFGQVLQPVYYTLDLADDDGSNDRDPVDLAISGPNYRHNLTSVYNLASKTVGGAIEAALCRKKAVSLFFAFGNHKTPDDDGVHSPQSRAHCYCVSNIDGPD
ncbi:MAG: hypothetical protein M1813_002370 [Trichoglossum hirsutum]|nr:MAG: hypothetical protein M1813_002370 [Trichoglossum hirsutum]